MPPLSLPPAARSRVALGLSAAAAEGVLALQVCKACGATQYPPREICRSCLSRSLAWRAHEGCGQLLAHTVIRRPYEAYFQAPHRSASYGSTMGECRRLPREEFSGPSGKDRALALPRPRAPRGFADDPLIAEFTVSPKRRNVLVTDGRSATGRALVSALCGAGGAAKVFVGMPEGASPELAPAMVPVALDITRPRSLYRLAAEIGDDLDILINTAQTFDAEDRGRQPAGREEMAVNASGFSTSATHSLRSSTRARRIGPAPGQSPVGVRPVAAAGMRNVLRLQAATLSLSRSVKAEIGASGVRVVNVFPGSLPQHEMAGAASSAPEKLANAIVSALGRGIEDVYPDAVAQDWHARWRDDPLASGFAPTS